MCTAAGNGHEIPARACTAGLQAHEALKSGITQSNNYAAIPCISQYVKKFDDGCYTLKALDLNVPKLIRYQTYFRTKSKPYDLKGKRLVLHKTIFIFLKLIYWIFTV